MYIPQMTVTSPATTCWKSTIISSQAFHLALLINGFLDLSLSFSPPTWASLTRGKDLWPISSNELTLLRLILPKWLGKWYVRWLKGMHT
jgi:hypothetical protein